MKVTQGKKPKGLCFKVSGHRSLFLLKYVPWHYFLECPEFFLNGLIPKPQACRSYKLQRQYVGIFPSLGLLVASSVSHLKCYIRTISSRMNVSFKTCKILCNPQSTVGLTPTLWQGSKLPIEMQLKLKRHTEEVPTGTRNRFQSIFSCHFPPKRCSFKTQSSWLFHTTEE